MIKNIKLLKKETIAKDTMAFYLEKPEGFTYIAGQFADYTLINPPETDDEGNIRGFSLASAPYEPELMFATRMRDTAFKRVLKDLPIESELKLDAPYGDFKLHKTHTTPAVFLIGGIGITPVRSIIAQATHDKLPHTITLFYANRTPDDAAFTDDFKRYAAENPHFTFIPVYTGMEESKWKGERGHITADMLKRHVADLHSPIYYISGPVAMVKTMREILTKAQINEDNIRTEEFSGY